jgi:hypothetical protein
MLESVSLPNLCHHKNTRRTGLFWGLVLVSCARTGLLSGELDDDGSGSGDVGEPVGEGGARSEPARPSAGAEALAGASSRSPEPNPTEEPNEPEEPNDCEPTEEVCNGRDDDCNGAVDDLPPRACDGGGFSFCVAGKMSACPRRCEVCVPGSVRVCQNNYCTFWGEQECAADGQGFGNCREQEPPPECAQIARKYQDSPELQRCCLDNGYCCKDEHDLDGDGDRREMLGACDDIACR